MSIELLLVGECFEVRLDGERHNRRRVVSEVLLQRFRVDAARHDGCLDCMGLQDEKLRSSVCTISVAQVCKGRYS